MKTLLMLCLSFTLSYGSSEEEKAAIETTLGYYMDGGTNRDFSTLKKAFHEKAIMTRITEEGLVQINAREFFSGMKPGEPLNRTTEIVSIDIAGNTAVARLKLEDDAKIFHDFMTLQKISGQWLVVNKSFHLERK